MDDMRPQSRSQEEARPRERAHRGRKLDPAPLTGGIGVERLVDDFFFSYNAGRLRESLPYQFLVDRDTAYADQSYSSAVAVYGNGFDFKDLAKHQRRDQLLRPVPEVLAFLRTIDSIKPDLLCPAIVEDGDAVPVNDADDFAGPCGGSRRQQEQGERQEPRKTS
jgi:hypothetical protein